MPLAEQKVEFGDVDKNKTEFQKEATSGWVAMVQHYFASAWILPDGVKRDLFVRKLDAASPTFDAEFARLIAFEAAQGPGVGLAGREEAELAHDRRRRRPRDTRRCCLRRC